MRTCWSESKEGHKDEQRAGGPLLGRQTGLFQPGEKKVLRIPYNSPPITKGGLQETWERDFLQGHVGLGQGEMALNSKRVDLD